MFTDAIVNLFMGLPKELAVFLLSLLPITELRASVPVGIEVYNLPFWEVLFISVIGNMVPPTIILLLIPKIHSWVMKQKILGAILSKFLERAEKKFSGNYEKYGLIALAIFVAIPLPLTGAWTGSLAAFVFNIPFKKSFPMILLGVCIAALIVGFMTISASGIFSLIFN